LLFCQVVYFDNIFIGGGHETFKGKKRSYIMDTLRKFPMQKAYKTKLATVPPVYRSRRRVGLGLSVWRERVVGVTEEPFRKNRAK